MLRGASLFFALAACFIGSVFPFLFGREPTGLSQTILLATMLGVTGAIIYGVGIRPRHRLAAAIIAPYATWPVMLGGCAVLILLR